MVILGGGDWSAEACNDIRDFIESNNLPAGCSFRRQDLLDNRHPNYCGEGGIGINPLLGERIRSADLILAIGPRLGEMTTRGSPFFPIPPPLHRPLPTHPPVALL